MTAYLIISTEHTMEVEANKLQCSDNATILSVYAKNNYDERIKQIRAVIPYASGMLVVEKEHHKIVMDVPNKTGERQLPPTPKRPPKDCMNLKMYGDGNKFLSPVWYPCGCCDVCKRLPKNSMEVKHEP